MAKKVPFEIDMLNKIKGFNAKQVWSLQ